MNDATAARSDEAALLRVIAGALRQTTDAHGPITRYWCGSAAKRVLAQLRAAGHLPSGGSD